MKVVIVNKIPLLQLCRNFFTLEFGIVDYDDLLDCLCLGLRANADDREHIRGMVYGDIWLQGHHEPYNNNLKTRLFRFLIDLRGRIINEIHHRGRVPYHLHIRYQSQFTTGMSLKFEVFG